MRTLAYRAVSCLYCLSFLFYLKKYTNTDAKSAVKAGREAAHRHLKAPDMNTINVPLYFNDPTPNSSSSVPVRDVDLGSNYSDRWSNETGIDYCLRKMRVPSPAPAPHCRLYQTVRATVIRKLIKTRTFPPDSQMEIQCQ